MLMPNVDTKKKYAKPTAFAKYKDTSLPTEKYLEVDTKQINDAKTGMSMKPMTIKFISDGPDRTLDENTFYGKQAKYEGCNAQMTVQELREEVAKQENMDVQDVNFYVRSTIIPNNLRVGQCYADWMGFGLENWPPQFISKPRIRGFEVNVFIGACRDISVWDNGKLNYFTDKTLTYDVNAATTVGELKDMIEKTIKIPYHRQNLIAMIHKEERSVMGEHIVLEKDNWTMEDYGVNTFCAKIVLEKKVFDDNGMYIFDDAYWDEKGYHSQPIDAFTPLDSLSNRARPDASEVDPNVPLNILTDRRAADNKKRQDEADAQKAKGKK